MFPPILKKKKQLGILRFRNPPVQLPSWEENDKLILDILEGFPGGSAVKNQPAKAGDLRDSGRIPRWEDPLEEKMATHSSILARRIPWTEEPAGLQSMGSKKS